jgi:hypothetical protein
MALIDDLEKEGYDTSGITPELISSLEKEGYDTAGLKRGESDGLSKAASFSKKVTGLLSKPLEPVGAAIGAIKQGSENLSNKLAESGHPFLAMHAAGPEIALDAMGKPFEWMNKAGEVVAEKGAEHGMNPYASAALGTAIQMAPDIAMGAEGIAKRAVLANLAKTGAEKVMAPVSEAAGKAKAFIKAPTPAEVALKNTSELADLQGEREASRLSAQEARLSKPEALQEVRQQGAQQLQDARQKMTEAKKNLIGAEEEKGLHFETTKAFEDLINNPAEMQKFIESKYPVIKQGAQELSQTADSQTLQHLRKVAQEAEKKELGLSDIAKSQLKQIKSVATDALGLQEPEVGAKLGDLRAAQTSAQELPAKIKQQIEAKKVSLSNDQLQKAKELSDIQQQMINQRAQGAQAMTKAEQIAFKKKLIKAGLVTAAGALGFKAFIH